MFNPTRSAADLPVFLQISEFLSREIAAGRLMDGERLPTERQMAVNFSTSVGTLRKALAELEKKGLLRRVHGSGNYVSTAGTDNSVYSMFRLELPGGGGLPRARVLSLDVMEKPGDLPAFGVDHRANRIRRLRFLGEVPVAVEEIWLDLSKGQIELAEISDSLYRYYQQRLGFWISRAEDWVSVAPVPAWAPSEFGPPLAAPAGYVERFGWADSAEPVEYSRNWFDPIRARYVQRLK